MMAEKMREESKERIRAAKAAMRQKKAELAGDPSFVRVEVRWSCGCV